VERITKKIQVQDIFDFKIKLLSWAQQYGQVSWLDSNNYPQKYSNFDAVLAVDAYTEIQSDYHKAFTKLKQYQAKIKDYIFGYLSFDLKNDIEDLHSRNKDYLQFPEMYFFQPKKIFFLKDKTLEIQYLNLIDHNIDEDLEDILNYPINPNHDGLSINQIGNIKKRISKVKYLKKLDTILKHIQKGDIYEVNLCQEFYAENTDIDPLSIYYKLNSITCAPFGNFLKLNDKFILGASPERFVKKEGVKIISQPIKGTAKRLANLRKDENMIKLLSKDPKERAENIMIVDLVRNDLSKTAVEGSVFVEELCKVYSFKQVHQLISTVVSKVEFYKNPVDIIKSLFPMGSMTGAPKIAAMKIIEAQEETKRGVYSGAVGYFSPENDFDFNVVIRSILYNQAKQYLSFSVGGAITSKSDPEKEYKECLVKAKAMIQVLTQNIPSKVF